MASNPKNWLRKLFPTNRRLLVERSLKSVKLKSCLRVLVVGSGHDPYRNLFTEPEIYLNLDIQSQNGITDVVGDAHTLPFESDSFDCILAIEVFEHLENPYEFVGEANRVLTKGGVIVVSVPFLFHQHGDPYDFWRPTQYTLEKYFTLFSSSNVLAQGNRLHVISDLISTTFPKFPVFFPLRIFNHILCCFTGNASSTAPSGFFAVGKK